MAESASGLIKKRSRDIDASPESVAKRSKTISYHASSPSFDGLSSESSSDSERDSHTSAEPPQRSRLSFDSHSVHSASDGDCDSSLDSSSSEDSSSPVSSSPSGEDDEESESDESETQSITDGPVSIPHLQTSIKPPIRLLNDSGLRRRLSSFLPILRRANEALERDIAAGKVKSVEISHEDMGKEEWQGKYIEMVCRLSCSRRY